MVYGFAYAIAVSAGFAQWSPGAGRCTTGSQIAANLVINLALLGVIGTLTAMGEEIGWRGYLQPRLDAAGIRSSITIVPAASGRRSSSTAFTNTISQWLYPRLFTVSEDQPWLRGEMGLLPMIGYIVLGTAMYVWMRLRGHTWETLSREALAPRSL